MRVFLFFVYLIILVAVGGVVSFFFNSTQAILAGDQQPFLLFLQDSFTSARAYFIAADAWNYLAMVSLLSALLLIFSLFSIIFHYALVGVKVGWKRWIAGRLISGLLTIFIFVLFTNYIVFHYSTERIFSHTDIVSNKTDVLLLGTRKVLPGGHINAYYRGRIDAVAELYKTGKVERVIISGDHTGDYNEPLDMMLDLIKAGVPQVKIIRDENGFRTLDSIVRIKNTYRVDRVIIVSQEFHLQRALFLAWFYDVRAIGFQASGEMTDQMIRRELLAKPNLFLDVFLLNTQPAVGKTSARNSWSAHLDDVILLLLVLMLLFGALLMTYHSFQLSTDPK